MIQQADVQQKKTDYVLSGQQLADRLKPSGLTKSFLQEGENNEEKYAYIERPQP